MLYGDQFQWLPPPYEYETIKAPIDILAGSHALREAIDSHCDGSVIDQLAQTSADWGEMLCDCMSKILSQA